MTREEAAAFLDNGPRWAVLSTVGRDGFPHSVPLGYFRVGDEVAVSVRGQRKVNIARNPKVGLLLEDGDSMANLRGLLVRGEATLVEDRQLLEIVLGPLWVWLAYDEVPAATTLAGGAIVAVAVVLQATADVRAAPRAVSEAA